jgi:hypothetical protein
VKNFHILLIPRPPAFAITGENISSSEDVDKTDPSLSEEAEMKILAPGADAVPAPVTQSTTKQHYRLITVGKKKFPNPEGHGSGSRRKEMFWATVTAIGDDLASLEKSLREKTYDTKTRGYIRCFPSSRENPRLRFFFRDETRSRFQTGRSRCIRHCKHRYQSHVKTRNTPGI